MKQYLLSYIKKRQYILLIGDILVIGFSLLISYLIRVYLTRGYLDLSVMLSKLNPWLFFVIFLHTFSLYLLDQYNITRLINIIRSSFMVVMSMALASVLTSGFFFFFPKYIFGRQVLLINLMVVSVFMVLWRLLYTEILLGRIKSKRLAVIGDGQSISSFIQELSTIQNSGFRITDICVPKKSGSLEKWPLPSYLNRHKNIIDLLEFNNFDALAFDSTTGFFSDSEIRHILKLKYRDKAVYDLPTLYKNLTGKVPLNYIDGHWLLNSDALQGEMNLLYGRVKRILDLMLSGLFLLITAPLFAILCIAIKLEGSGRIFFIQERLGIQKRPFKCVKFRTMVEDAESKSGPIWSSEKDSRITRVGYLLRKSRLDELPQLWNILKGDISFVGPRPIREHFANKLTETIPFYGLRFNVKPGLTGWAQVNYDYAGSEEGQLQKFQYELFYIQNMSLFLDLLIMLKTIKIVLLGKGE